MLRVDRQPATPGQSGPLRDPVDELYARAWDVVAAAVDLRAAARRKNDVEAVAATLGCVESALAHFAAANEMLCEASSDSISGASPILGEDAAREAQRAADAFSEAREAIGEARRACEAVHGAVGPLLAGGGAS